MPTTTEATPRTRITSTVVKETLPARDGAYPEEFYNRDFWEVIHSLTPEQWAFHLVRVYRCDERWEKGGAPEENKFTEDFTEDTIREKWGGGRYKLWLYGPPKSCKLVMPPERLQLDGQPHALNGSTSYYRPPDAPAAPTNSNGRSSTDILLEAMLAEMRESRGGNMIQDAMKTSLEIMGTAYKSAAAVIVAPRTESGGGDDIEKQLRQAMLNKFLNPPDPTESLKGIIAMVTAVTTTAKELGLGGGGGKPDILGSLIDKLPQVIEKAVGGMHEYRLASEAQRDSLQIQAQTRVIDIPANQPPTQSVPTQAATQPQPATTSPAAQPAKPEVVEIKGPSDEWVLLKLVDIIEKTDDTGEEVCQFLHYNAPSVLKQVSAMSRDNILALFAQHPILARVSTHARLPVLIDEILAALNPDSPVN